MVSVESKCSLKKKGTISNEHPQIDEQPMRIRNVQLHRYQLQTIYAMKQLEMDVTPLASDEQLYTEIGILANKVGSGKSLCALGLISEAITLPLPPLIKELYGNYAHISVDRSSCMVGKNLIVVPNHILKPVWEKYLDDYTDFTYIQVRKSLFPIDWASLQSYDIVLCNAKLYNIFIKSCPLCWSRVIYDEADSICIPACVKPRSRFVWFVTSSLNNLLFCDGYYWKRVDSKIVKVVTSGIPNHGFIKNTFKTLEGIKELGTLSSFIVKMNDGYVDGYLNLPRIERRSIVCQTPYYLRAIHEQLSDHVLDLLHGDDLGGAMLALGCPVDTKENLISFITRSIQIELKNVSMKIEYLEGVETYDDASRHRKNNKLSKSCDERKTLTNRIERIKSVISSIDMEDEYYACPICKEVKRRNVVFSCCLNMFCEDCVSQLLIRNTGSCPLCRRALHTQNIIRPVDEPPLTGFKHDVLISFVNSGRVKKTVVFYKQEASIERILPLLTRSFKVLNGNNNTIVKTLEWFRTEADVVLFVNVELYACGLNLIDATDIVFYQRMSAELENQLIGRAYRYGRDPLATLCVHSLLHCEETT
jgi:hypothetical protein